METGNSDNFNGNFDILSKFFQIFRDNLDSNLGKSENLHYRVRGRSPTNLANLLKIY